MDQLRKIFSNKKILIYGLGISGYSSFNFLKKKIILNFLMTIIKILKIKN